ncbi:LysM peptidoglycan-binding domain-containing protein [Ornithinicoccus halotolerans]|uniref:LysM peptidoglycan-binding domain-containing protein n=1 Tax=Ornithinicoccus halotolerans TaxID=1748220 RepID=UPI0012954FFF|nr:LysM peptidoglycan-binding domain-containing protein [Ornithinicoccus halotolerans]
MSPMPADLPPAAPQVSFSQHGPLATASSSWRPYRVQEGDTLYDLAAKFDTTVSALTKRNGLSHGGRWIYAGQTIEVPGKGNGGGGRSGAGGGGGGAGGGGGSGSASRGGSITVQPGDTLYDIAARHDTTVAALVRANSFDNPRMIYPGQKISLPGSQQASRSTSGSTAGSGSSKAGSGSTSGGSGARAGSSTSAASSRTVTVRAGDTLSGIAARHGVPLSEVIRANSSLDPHRLWVGQRVTIPVVERGRAQVWTPDNIGDAKKGEKVDNTFLHYTYDDKVARSAAANREYLASVPVPDAQETKSLIVRTANRHGVDPTLMLAVSSTESGWNQRAVSPANAIGIMQVIPTTGEWASSLVGRELNLLDPKDNVEAGVVVMRALLRAADSREKAIAGYYQGLASVQQHGMFSDTKHYVKTVLAVRSRM